MNGWHFPECLGSRRLRAGQCGFDFGDCSAAPSSLERGGVDVLAPRRCRLVVVPFVGGNHEESLSRETVTYPQTSRSEG